MNQTEARHLESILRQQESLRTIIESISSELELRPLLTRIVQHACELLAADRGTIGLVDEERNLVRTEAVYRMPENELGLEMPRGVGLAGSVLESHEPLILNHYGELNDPVQTDLVQDAVIGLPIFWADRMIGFFGIGAEPPRSFDQQDVELLSLLARHAAIAIENARHFAAEKRRASRQRTLTRLGEIISRTLEQDDLLQTAVTAICDHLDYSDAGFLLADPEGEERLTLVARSGVYERLPADFAITYDEGIAGAAARTRQSILTKDAPHDPRLRPIPDAIVQSVISTPIIVSGQLLGVLNVSSTETLDEDDVTLLKAAGNQLGIAIVNARLFDKEKRRAARQATLNRIGKLVTATLELDNLLQTAVIAIDEELAYSNTALLLVDQENPDQLVLTARSGIYADYVQGPYAQAIDAGIIGEAATTRQPLFIPDVTKDPRYIPIPGANDICSELALPIIVAGRLLGVLNVETNRPIDRDEAADLELVVDQLAVAITNAHLFEQMERNLAETQLLYETSRRMTNAFDVDDVIEAYLQHVAVRGQYVCTVALYDFNDFGERIGVIERGVWSPSHGLQLCHNQLPYSRDSLDPLLDQGQTVLMSDVHADPRASRELREIQSDTGRPALAFIPLIVRRQRIGVVVLTYPGVIQWRESELWPYQVTAAQLATAIDTRQQQSLLVQSGQEVAVLRERQRLARELHDSVTQLMFSMTLVAQSVAPAWQRDPEEGERRVGRILELSQSALAEMRALLFELRSSDPPPLPTESGVTLPGITRLRRDGLIAALTKHIESLQLEEPRINLETSHYQPQKLEMEIALFRITQEALNNVAKHAQATRVHINLQVTDDAVWLNIQDNGLGFDPRAKSPTSREGLGLRTMQERAEALHGTLKIESTLGQGTLVKANLPLTPGEKR